MRRLGSSLWPSDPARPVPSRNGVGRLGYIRYGPQSQSHDPDCGGDENSEDDKARPYDGQAQAVGRSVNLSQGCRHDELPCSFGDEMSTARHRPDPESDPTVEILTTLLPTAVATLGTRGDAPPPLSGLKSTVRWPFEIVAT